MGVRGLASFFDCNPHLKTIHELHETKVVIDGNNFVYWLYRNSRADYRYGGDYEKFSKTAKEYLKIFKRCNIKPLVIFDGGYDSSEWNFHKVHRRSKDRLKASQQIADYGCSSQLILPILVWDAFKCILDMMDIQYAQCDYGADDQIVAVANYFRCPVISQDSDFYIFDITCGFIRLDSIEWVVHTESNDSATYSFMICSIYFVNNFLSNFPGMDISMLPLFATLIGNDVTEVITFESFFSNIKLPNRRSKRLKINKHHRKMIGLLNWLQNQTVEEATQYVINVIAKNKKNLAKELLEQSMQEYNRRNTILIKFLEDTDESEDLLSQDLCLNSFFGKKLPTWFTVKFHRSCLDSIFLNIVGLHCVFLPTQVEDPKCPSSYECTLPLRRILYGICLQFDEENDTGFSNPNHHDRLKCVKEYDRLNKCLSSSYIDYHIELSNYGKIPSINDIEKMNKDDKLILFLTLMGVDLEWLQCFPEKWIFLFITLFYWLKNSSSAIVDSFLNAILVSVIFFSLLKGLLGTANDDVNIAEHFLATKNLSLKSNEEKTSDASINFLVASVTVEEASKVSDKLQKFCRKPQHNNAKPIHIEIVHNYSQLQACFLFASYFTKVLDIFPSLSTFQYLNGTFLYNLTNDIMTRKEPELYIAELLGRNSVTATLFSKLKMLIIEYASSKGISMINVKTKEKNKKKLKKALLESVISNSNSNELIENNILSDQICSSGVENHSVIIENRFKNLIVNSCA